MKWMNETLSQVQFRFYSKVNYFYLFKVNPDIHLDQFKHKIDFHDNYSTNSYDISYPGLIMKITLRRSIGYHVLQTFVPSTLFVILGK